MDLAAGQGSAARACLLERVPYFGFVLGEQHGKKLEMQLTDFLLEEMRREGSSHYRPEAAKAPQTADETEEKAKPEKPKKRDNPGNEKEAKPPQKKPKKTKGEKEPKQTPEAEGEAQGEGEEEAGGDSPLPW